MGKKYEAKPTSWKIKLKDPELTKQQTKDNERNLDMLKSYLDGLDYPHDLMKRKKSEQS